MSKRDRRKKIKGERHQTQKERARNREISAAESDLEASEGHTRIDPRQTRRSGLKAPWVRLSSGANPTLSHSQAQSLERIYNSMMVWAQGSGISFMSFGMQIRAQSDDALERKLDGVRVLKAWEAECPSRPMKLTKGVAWGLTREQVRAETGIGNQFYGPLLRQALDLYREIYEKTSQYRVDFEPLPVTEYVLDFDMDLVGTDFSAPNWRKEEGS